jgi:hypothetical protein
MDDNFVQLGGLTMSDFEYTVGVGNALPTTAASEISVDALGNNGLRFDGPFIDRPGGDGSGASLYNIEYLVTGGASGARLAGNPSVENAPGDASVTMSMFDSGLPPEAKTQLVIFNNIAGNTPLLIEDSSDFGTVVNSYRANTAILLRTDSQANERATLSTIEQVHVPEPASMGLLALGVLALVMLGRRQK